MRKMSICKISSTSKFHRRIDLSERSSKLPFPFLFDRCPPLHIGFRKRVVKIYKGVSEMRHVIRTGHQVIVFFFLGGGGVWPERRIIMVGLLVLLPDKNLCFSRDDFRAVVGHPDSHHRHRREWVHLRDIERQTRDEDGRDLRLRWERRKREEKTILKVVLRNYSLLGN